MAELPKPLHKTDIMQIIFNFIDKLQMKHGAFVQLQLLVSLINLHNSIITITKAQTLDYNILISIND